MKFFDRLQLAVTNRSKENLDCFHTTTTDFGRLDCPYWVDVVEGEDITFNMSSFFNAGCMVVPTRGRIFMNIRAFFVPNRILVNNNGWNWNNWRLNLTNAAHPYIDEMDLINRYRSSDSGLSAAEKKDLRRLYSQLALCDRMFNTTTNKTYAHPERLTPFPFLAYNRIWWDFYRDSNLISDEYQYQYVVQPTSGKITDLSWLRPRYCCYGKDYFTTAKLNAQSGGTVAVNASGSAVMQQAVNPQNVIGSSNQILVGSNSGGYSVQFIRAANAMQRMMERYNIAGGRVMARFLARFGQAPDSIRLDQAEYLGGTSHIMEIGGVTSPMDIGSSSGSNPFIGDSTSLAGQRAGRGVIDGSIPTIKFHAKEHGIFMVIATLVPEIGYYQGLHKCWQRGVNNDKDSYLCPEFDCLGYEPVFNKELALCDLEEDSTNANLWGFQRRYGSYCYHNNIASGDLVLSETRTGMEAFHLMRDFRSSGTIYTPALNAQFTMITPEARTMFDRIFQIIGGVAERDHFEGYHNSFCEAILPKSPNALPSLEEDEHSQNKISVDNGGTRF